MAGTDGLVDLVSHAAGVGALADALAGRRRVAAVGVGGSSTALLAAALMNRLGRGVLLVVAHLDDAEEALDELEGLGVPALRLPAAEGWESGEGGEAALQAQRALAALEMMDGSAPRVVVAPVQALLRPIPTPQRLAELTRVLVRGREEPLGSLLEWLTREGYKRVTAVEEAGQFSVRGGLVDIFIAGAEERLVRLDFFGDTLEQIHEVEPTTMSRDRALDRVALVSARPGQEKAGVSPAELVPAQMVGLIAQMPEVVEQGRAYYERCQGHGELYGPPHALGLLERRLHAVAEVNAAGGGEIELDVRGLELFERDLGEALDRLIALAREHGGALVCCQTAGELARLEEILAPRPPQERALVRARVLYLHRGFVWRNAKGGGAVLVVPYHELLSRFAPRRRVNAGAGLKGSVEAFWGFAAGDYVVHTDHGIAKFLGLTLMKPRALPGQDENELEDEEYLTLQFAGRAKLHVPVTQADRVQRYVGAGAGTPTLSTIGGKKWKGQRQRAAEGAKTMAAQLLRVRAARQAASGLAFPADTPWQQEFEAQFPYTETQDQINALAAIKRDMQQARPMDRLICGDVGFGKTELAIRAAFKACESGRQVAVLVPTTVLAEQHERTFTERFAGFPFRVESISRFKTDKEARAILEALAAGKVDIIIGTHRLLSKDVAFANLGLVVVDEEQRFGVEHKERLLQLRLSVDVLTLSATPIPRTLHMAMLGLRDISSLTTAPADRRAIVTEVLPFSERRVRDSIARELAREGQVFVVHNRVHDIHTFADRVRALCPEGTKVVVGHGQMPDGQLEDVMLDFVRGPRAKGASILVSTTIIESGIDIPTANTIIINNADRFGLSELHQLRGRVGRSKHRAYCDLLYSPEKVLTAKARQRLAALERHAGLGAGFAVAMRDLEIRGAGNLLGAEQSGHIAAVGYELYCQLLKRAAAELTNEPLAESAGGASVEIGLGGLLPASYIPSQTRRLEVYRRLALAASNAELDKARADLVDAYGEPPPAAQRLVDLARLRLAALGYGVRTVTIREGDVVFRVLPARGGELAHRLRESSGASRQARPTVTLLAPAAGDDLAEVYMRPPRSWLAPASLLAVLLKRLA